MADKNAGAAAAPASPDATATAGAKGPGDTMLSLDFVAGRISLPIGKLAEWVPQHVINEEGVFFPRIQAVCNGSVIAEGELVQMGSQIGFRVLRVIRPL